MTAYDRLRAYLAAAPDSEPPSLEDLAALLSLVDAHIPRVGPWRLITDTWVRHYVHDDRGNTIAADVYDEEGWSVWGAHSDYEVANGAEAGEEGKAAADAQLREMGVIFCDG